MSLELIHSISKIKSKMRRQTQVAVGARGSHKDSEASSVEQEWWVRERPWERGRCEVEVHSGL